MFALPRLLPKIPLDSHLKRTRIFDGLLVITALRSLVIGYFNQVSPLVTAGLSNALVLARRGFLRCPLTLPMSSGVLCCLLLLDGIGSERERFGGKRLGGKFLIPFARKISKEVLVK